MFLLAAPPRRCTAECTMRPIWLTNTMTSSCRHSVMSVNCRMSQYPNIAVTCKHDILVVIMLPSLVLKLDLNKTNYR